MLALDELTGRTVDKYVLEEMVGEGGHAVVYRAEHQELRLPVALKFLHPQYTRNPQVRDRFQQEARLQFKLRHPYIVRVTDLIQEQRLCGMAMDWIEGMDLKDYMMQVQRPLSLPEIRAFFLPVLHAVEHAHKQQVIHRDLKPANILLEDVDGYLYPRVTDFGIAKSLDSGDGVHTSTGVMLGTPHYMAPEQAEKEKDHRMDIYSLGVILYELLTGRVPFSGASTIELYMAHLHLPPPRPGRLRPDLDPHLEAIVLKALAKEPHKRFSSCAAFANALNTSLNRLYPGNEPIPRPECTAQTQLDLSLSSHQHDASHTPRPDITWPGKLGSQGTTSSDSHNSMSSLPSKTIPQSPVVPTPSPGEERPLLPTQETPPPRSLPYSFTSSPSLPSSQSIQQEQSTIEDEQTTVTPAVPAPKFRLSQLPFFSSLSRLPQTTLWLLLAVCVLGGIVLTLWWFS